MQRLGEDQREYLRFCRDQRGLSRNSILAYEQDLACFVRWEAVQQTRPNVDDEALVAFHRFLRTENAVSPATARRRIVTLKAFMKWRAKRDEGVQRSFAELELDLRIPRRLPRPVERDTLVELLSSSPHITPRSISPTSGLIGSKESELGFP